VEPFAVHQDHRPPLVLANGSSRPFSDNRLACEQVHIAVDVFVLAYMGASAAKVMVVMQQFFGTRLQGKVRLEWLPY
jgi:hypothetical protein